MSIQRIVDYVRQTPGNTNPSVVASMVGAEMNGTLREAKEYTDEKFSSIVPKKIKTLTWDIANDSSETILVDYTVSKLSNKFIDFDSVVKIKLWVKYNEEVEASKSEIKIIDGSLWDEKLTGVYIWAVEVDGENVIIAFSSCVKNEYVDIGFYAKRGTQRVHFNSIDFEEEYVNSNYLPGICLPIIDLGEIGGVEVSLGFNSEIQIKLNEAIKGNLPIVARGLLGKNLFFGVFLVSLILKELVMLLLLVIRLCN